MSQIFYLIRHGETDWNVERRLQGHSDIDLNATGERQAQGLRNRMTTVKIDKVITSDLVRAKKTALLGLSDKFITTPALREVHLGQAEGKTKDELQALHGADFWEQWTSHQATSMDLRFPEGESKSEMLARLLPCLNLYLDSNPLLTLAFVSHGLAMRTLTHHLNPDLAETHFVGNCGVLKMQRSPDKKLRLLEYFDPSQIVK